MSEPPAKRMREDDSVSRNYTPITLLSGFLGAGKTTLLKHVLENKQGLKVGVIVNDMAEVNIDAALVHVRSDGATGGQATPAGSIGGTLPTEDTVEMANGCVCCSAAEELITSIDKLASIAEKRAVPWDHIVIETTGVAEPREVRDNIMNVHADQPEMMRGTMLHTLVTVVDASTFMDEFQKRNKVEERADLGANEFTDGTRQVVDLMCEQVETADVVIANKTDLISADELALLRATLATLNPLAAVLTSERGVVELKSVLAAAGDDGVAKVDEDGDLRRLVAHVKGREAAEDRSALHEHGHKEPVHEHGHDGECEDGSCADKGHEHGHAEHGHDHGHNEHANGHGESVTAFAHEHNHAEIGRHQKRFGITSFVYQRRRPFHPHRLMQVIKHLPVRQGEGALALADAVKREAGGDTQPPAAAAQQAHPMHALVRSKGFIWLSNSHPQMFTWALAGKHFELKQYAAWWDSVPEEEWPEEESEKQTIRKDFDGEFGDHRQELVFIGVKMDKKAIVKLFDECLLTDTEMDSYRKHWLS